MAKRELSEIFEIDPLSLTKDDEEIEDAIEGFRAMRKKFILGDTKAGKVKASKYKVLKGIDVDALNLDLKI